MSGRARCGATRSAGGSTPTASGSPSTRWPRWKEGPWTAPTACLWCSIASAPRTSTRSSSWISRSPRPGRRTWYGSSSGARVHQPVPHGPARPDGRARGPAAPPAAGQPVRRLRAQPLELRVEAASGLVERLRCLVAVMEPTARDTVEFNFNSSGGDGALILTDAPRPDEVIAAALRCWLSTTLSSRFSPISGRTCRQLVGGGSGFRATVASASTGRRGSCRSNRSGSPSWRVSRSLRRASRPWERASTESPARGAPPGRRE